jgi:hypothetical protein
MPAEAFDCWLGALDMNRYGYAQFFSNKFMLDHFLACSALLMNLR